MYVIILVKIPDYLTLLSGDNHFDNLSFLSNIVSTTRSINSRNKSLFIRLHTLWTAVPFPVKN